MSIHYSSGRSELASSDWSITSDNTGSIDIAGCVGYYFSIQGRNRVGLSQPIYSSLQPVTGGIKLTIDIFNSAYLSGENWFGYVISASDSLVPSTFRQIAYVSIKGANTEDTVPTFPYQIELAENEDILAETFATPDDLLTIDRLNGKVSFVNSLNSWYEFFYLDTTTIDNVFVLNGNNGRWKLRNSPFTLITDITDFGGSDVDIRSDLSGLDITFIPTYTIDATDSPVIRYTLFNDSLVNISIGSNIIFEVFINGLQSIGLLKNSLFIRYLGYVNKTTGLLRTTKLSDGTPIPEIGNTYIYNIDSTNLFNPDTLQANEGLIIEVVVNLNPVNLNVVLNENSSVVIYPSFRLFNIQYSPFFAVFTDGVIVNSPDFLLITPELSKGVLIAKGQVLYIGYSNTRNNAEIISLFPSNVNSQLTMDNLGTLNIIGELDPIPVTAIRIATVSTVAGETINSSWETVTLAASDAIDITVNYPVNAANDNGIIRSNYDSIYLQGEEGKFTPITVNIYIRRVSDGEIRKFPVAVIIDDTQLISITDFNGTVILPAAIPTEEYGFYTPTTTSSLPVVGGGTFAAGVYEVSYTLEYDGDQISNISDLLPRFDLLTIFDTKQELDKRLNVNTTAAFTQPNPQITTPILVNTTADLLVGMTILLDVAGYYQITSIDSETAITARNLGISGINALPSTVIPLDTQVEVSGEVGISAFSVTTLDFIQPVLNGTVQITVDSTEWIGQGLYIFIESAGTFEVVSIDSNILVTVRSEDETNTTSGTNIVAGVNVSPAGRRGLSSFSYTTADFTMPVFLGNVPIQIEDTTALAVGLYIYIDTAGYFEIISIADVNNLTVQSSDATNTASGTNIVSGSQLRLVGQPGQNGIDGNDPNDGADGADATATTTNSFIQPTGINTVDVDVDTSAWMVPNQYITIENGGVYVIQSVLGPTQIRIIHQSVGTFATPGATVTAGQLVSVAGAPGANGNDGASAFTQTTGNFTIPAENGGTTNISVVSTALMEVGQYLYILTGGEFEVSNVIDPVTVEITNYGGSNNGTPGSTVTSPASVIITGRQGIDAVTTTTANFNIPAVTDSPLGIAVKDSRGFNVNQFIHIAGAGEFQVNAIPDRFTLNIVNTGFASNTAPTTTINSPAQVVSTGKSPNNFVNTTANFTQPTVNSNVTIAVNDSTWVTIGQALFIEGGGIYQVISIPNAASIEVENLYNTNTAPTTSITFPKKVTPSGFNGQNGSVTTATSLQLDHQGSDPSAIAAKVILYSKTDDIAYYRKAGGGIVPLEAIKVDFTTPALQWTHNVSALGYQPKVQVYDATGAVIWAAVSFSGGVITVDFNANQTGYIIYQ